MQEYWQVENPLEPKVACAFGSGIGRRGSLCGVITGGVIAISWKFGTNEPSSVKRQQAYSLALEFYNQFVDRCGSPMCRELIGYDLTNPKQAEQARQSNVYQKKCNHFLEIGIELLTQIPQLN
jgi:C_GCAxxG_C_C family probable redox protein